MARFGGDGKDLIEVLPVKELLYLLKIIDPGDAQLRALYTFIEQGKVLVQRDMVLEFPSVLVSRYRTPAPSTQQMEEEDDGVSEEDRSFMV